MIDECIHTWPGKRIGMKCSECYEAAKVKEQPVGLSQLKRCPFCGSNPEQGSCASGFWKVACVNPKCLADRPASHGYTEQCSIDAWNSRTLERL